MPCAAVWCLGVYIYIQYGGREYYTLLYMPTERFDFSDIYLEIRRHLLHEFNL